METQEDGKFRKHVGSFVRTLTGKSKLFGVFIDLSIFGGFTGRMIWYIGLDRK
jgi:hypothetical protein